MTNTDIARKMYQQGMSDGMKAVAIKGSPDDLDRRLEKLRDRMRKAIHFVKEEYLTWAYEKIRQIPTAPNKNKYVIPKDVLSTADVYSWAKDLRGIFREMGNMPQREFLLNRADDKPGKWTADHKMLMNSFPALIRQMMSLATMVNKRSYAQIEKEYETLIKNYDIVWEAFEKMTNVQAGKHR